MQRDNRNPKAKSDGSGRTRNTKQPQQATKDIERAPYTDPVVFRVRRSTQCAKCKEELSPGRMIKLEGDGDQRIALCKGCAGLGELFFVPAGNGNLTRLLSKYSKLKHIVVRWASARKRYERQGVLVELEALNRAEQDLGLPLTIDEDITCCSDGIYE